MAFALAVGMAACLSAAAQAQTKTSVAWGGSNPGGVMYYMVGVAGAELSKDLPDVNITQVTTGGSTENAKRLIKGELDMGIVYGSHVYMAQKPTGPFANGPKGDMLRGVAMAYEGPTYFVALASSGIKKLDDLAGKRVALGPPGSGTVFNCSNILKALGLADKIKPQMMTFGDAGRALGNGQIDAFCQSSSPAAAVTELAETRAITILPYGEEQLAKINKTYPFYHTGTMAATTYKGVPATKMPFTTVYWVAHKRVPADVVKRMVASAYKRQAALAKGHKAWAQMKPDITNFEALGVPMHPGAAAYYAEHDKK
jgi:TRAP transporter TAXI family solute receptor